jgi:hypothetical protein
MNRIPTPGLLFAALCSAAACEATVTPATDAAAPMDAPRDAPADVSAGPDTAALPDIPAALPDIPAALPDIPAASPDVRPLRGAGTCASPIDLNAEGTAEGSDLVYRGTTAGMGDVLHPYEGCVARDAAEVVLSYRVPAGSGALMLTTRGSAYDTVLYVRVACSQAMAGVDTSCNNDSYDDAPRSTVYVTNALEGQTLFVVVDGNTDMDTTPAGPFVLTLRRVPFGAMGTPCRAITEPATARCEGALRCSDGGAADGTAICVPPVATNASCDPRGFTNLCLDGVTCVTEAEPPKGMAAVSRCSLPGARRGAPCRTAEPRCDGALACSAADPGICVPVLSLGINCDPTGEANRCGPGRSCAPLGDGGLPLCH